MVFLVSLRVINKIENLRWENNPLFCIVGQILHSILNIHRYTHTHTLVHFMQSSYTFLPAVNGVCSACDRDLYIIVCSAYSVRACLYVLRSTRFIIDHEIKWEKEDVRTRMNVSFVYALATGHSVSVAHMLCVFHKHWNQKLTSAQITMQCDVRISSVPSSIRWIRLDDISY